MPTFMDFHDDLPLSAASISQLAQETKDEKYDQFGVRQVELFYNPEGKVYCLLEAPDEAAVRRHHQALGVSCGEIHQVSSLLSPD